MCIFCDKMANVVDGYIENEHDGMVDRQNLMVCSEEERQENERNRANAELVDDPVFFIVYTDTLDLNKYEMLLYAHMRTFNKKKGRRYYFTNKQLAEMLRTTERTISQSIKKLSEMGLIDVHYKRAPSGGQTRFVNLDPPKSRDEETSSSYWKKLLGISIKNISNNKKEKSKKKKKDTAANASSQSLQTAKEGAGLPSGEKEITTKALHEAIDLWKLVDPTNYTSFFKMKVQRKATEDMLKQTGGLDKYRKVIDTVVWANKEQYGPRIYTPNQLKTKYQQLQDFIIRETTNRKGGVFYADD